MSPPQLILELVFFYGTLWLGLYLISRDWRTLFLWIGGGALLCRALLAAISIVQAHSSFLPLFISNITSGINILFLISIVFLLYSISLNRKNSFLIDFRPFYWIIAISIVSSLLIIAMFVSSLAFSPGSVFPWFLSIAIGCCIIPLGLLLAYLDAQLRGERLLPHVLRSFDYSCGITLLFGGQVVVVMLFAGVSLPLMVLLLTTMSAAVFTQVFFRQVVTVLDKIAFAFLPQLQQQRDELQVISEIVTRATPEFDPEQIDDAEFARLTRRALSNLGDLPRLATSPLVHLPIVQDRLRYHGAKDDTLERAHQLKQVLLDSILRLKPLGESEFGTAPEWRYYNALYFPYVVGLKPYSRRTSHHVQLSQASCEALEWFRQHIPERTLYNWQQTANKMIAGELRSPS